MKVIDGDGHLVEPLHLFRDYVPAAFHDRIRVDTDAQGWAERIVIGNLVMQVGGPARPGRPWAIGDGFTPGGLRPGAQRGRRFEESEPGGWDAQRRLEIHDREDIVAAVIFATTGLHVGAVEERDVALVAAQAINDWAADYKSAAPDELYIIATLPEQFPDLAAAELRRCVEQHGFVGGAVRPMPSAVGHRLDDPALEVLWDTAQELDVPICIHNVAAADRPQLGWERCSNFLTLHATVHPVEGMVAFATMYQGGVFDRHPRLRAGYMESGCGWAPFWLERLHEHWEGLGWLMDAPSDPWAVFQRQCFVGCEGEERMVPYVQDTFGEESVVWASDFPHFDTAPPFTADMLTRTDMSESQRDGVMRRAAIKQYGLDWDRIVAANTRRRAATAAVGSAR